MPRKSAFKCYFGCFPFKGKVHQFPPPEYPYSDKFDQWKAVLSELDKKKGDTYICNNIRICDHHFEDFYKTTSGRLTKAAVPTLNIVSTATSKHINEQNRQTDEIPSLHFGKEFGTLSSAEEASDSSSSEEPPESDPLLLNPDDTSMSQDAEVIQSNAICVCCLQSFKNYIKLSVCQHLEYLYQFSETKLDLQNEAVCYYCHSYLNKIQAFNQQVKENLTLFVHKKAINIDENQRQNSRVYNVQASAFIEVSIIPEEIPQSHRQQVTNREY